MPDGRVRINKEVMQTAINNYKTQKADALIAVYKLDDLINRQLDGFWDGQASVAFIAQFNKMFENLRPLEDKMEEFINNLQGVLDTYEEHEVSVEDLFSGLEEGAAYSNDYMPTM